MKRSHSALSTMVIPKGNVKWNDWETRFRVTRQDWLQNDDIRNRTAANRMLDTYENGKSIRAYNKTGSGYRATERQKMMDRYQGCCGKTAGLGAKAADARPGSMCGWILYSFTWDKTTRIMTQECNSNYWPACADGFYTHPPGATQQTRIMTQEFNSNYWSAC